MINRKPVLPIFLIFSAILISCLPITVSASVFYSKDRYVVAAGDTIDDDIYMAGSEGLFKGLITGDIIVVAKDYTMSGEVRGSVNSGSQSATITGVIGNSARIFAQRVYIDGDIGGNLLAFGEDLDITENSRIGKDATVFGSEISIAGIIGGNLRADGGQIVISGKIEGDITLEANKISIVAPAEITGDIVYKSKKEIRIEEDVIVGGEIEWREIDEVEKVSDGDGIGTVFRILLFLASLVTGLFIIGLSNRHCRLATEHIIQKSVVSLGVGFVAFCVIPVAIVALTVLIIGIPAAIIMLFAYTVFFYIAKIYVAIAIGRLGIRAFKKDIEPKQGWSLLFGLILLTILFMIPVLGWIIYFAVVFWGLGGILLAVRACRLNLNSVQLDVPTTPSPPVT